MSGTTPGNSSGDEPREDPFAQPSQEQGRDPSREQSEPPRWEQDDSPSSPYAQPAPEAPKSIFNAVRLMYVGAGLAAVNLIFALLSRDSLRDAIVESNEDLSASEVDSLVNMYYGVGAVMQVIAIALWLWMASANKKGRSWARVVATVLGGLNILFTLLNLTAGGFNLSTIMNLVTLVLAAYILYLLYRPESGEYYRTMSKPRTY